MKVFRYYSADELNEGQTYYMVNSLKQINKVRLVCENGKLWCDDAHGTKPTSVPLKPV